MKIIKAKNETVKITIKLTKEMDRKIRELAIKKNTSISQLVRDFIDKGIMVKGYHDEIGFIRTMLREELESILKPQIDRFAKLIVKGNITSAGAYILSAKAIANLLPPEYRSEFKLTIDESKKMAIVYVQGKNVDLDKLLEKVQ